MGNPFGMIAAAQQHMMWTQMGTGPQDRRAEKIRHSLTNGWAAKRAKDFATADRLRRRCGGETVLILRRKGPPQRASRA